MSKPTGYIVYGETHPELDDIVFYTLNDLLDLCNNYPDHRFTLIGTEYSLDTVGSWRGSYEIPSMTPTREVRTGKEIAEEIANKSGKTMYGYKGGEYTINIWDEFYISQYSASSEYKVYGYYVDTENNNVQLLTHIDEY